VGGVKININKKENYSEEFSTKRGNPDTKEMYTLLREKVSDFGDDVDVVPVKNYVGFKRNQRFLSVRVRREKLILAIRQIYNGKECFTDENDITKVHGRHKNWRESHIKTPDELEPLLVFIRQSYDANKK